MVGARPTTKLPGAALTRAKALDLSRFLFTHTVFDQISAPHAYFKFCVLCFC